jgi:hypothetical protein
MRLGYIEFPRPFILAHLPKEQKLHEIIGMICVVVTPCLGIYKKVAPHVIHHITKVGKVRMKGFGGISRSMNRTIPHTAGDGMCEEGQAKNHSAGKECAGKDENLAEQMEWAIKSQHCQRYSHMVVSHPQRR